MKKLKIYGERNTGTNYFIKLVDAHLDIPLLDGNSPTMKIGDFRLPTGSNIFQNNYFRFTWKKNMGWKHSEVNVKKLTRHKSVHDTYFCTLSKNPYAFLLSLYKRPYHYKGDRSVSFLEFLSTPWEVQARDNSDRPHYKTPIELWNVKNQSYIDLKRNFPKRVLTLKYEDLITNPEKMLDDIAGKFQIDSKKSFENLIKSTKDSDKTYEYYKNYYLQELWREKLSEAEFEWINAHLDAKVLEYFGYTLITPGSSHA